MMKIKTNKSILYVYVFTISLLLSYMTMTSSFHIFNFIALTFVFMAFYVLLISFFKIDRQMKWRGAYNFQTVSCAILATLLSCWTTISFVGSLNELEKFKTIYYVITAILVIAMALLNYFILLNVYQNKSVSKTVLPKRSIVFRILTVSGLVTSNLVCFVAYYPGIMMTDSLWQWQQLKTNVYSNVQPVMNTMIIKLCMQLWNSVASYALLQNVLYIFTMSWIFIYFYERVSRRSSKCLIIGLLVLAIISPFSPIMNQFITKDSLSASIGLILTFLIYRMLVQPNLLESKFFLLTVFIIVFLFSGLRTNSLIAFVAFEIVFLACHHSRMFFRWHSVAFLAIMLELLVTGPFYKSMNVQPSDPSESFGVPTQILAAVYDSNGNISAKERNSMLKILPDVQWRQLYSPYSVDSIKFAPGSAYNRDYISHHLTNLTMMTLKLALKNPRIALKAYYNQTRPFWKVNVGSYNPFGSYDARAANFTTVPGREASYLRNGHVVNYRIPSWIDDMYGHSPVKIHSLYVQFSSFIYRQKLTQVVSFPATIFILSMWLLSISVVSSKWSLVMSQVLPIMIFGTLIIAIPAQQFRYYDPFYWNFELLVLAFVFEHDCIDNFINSKNDKLV